MKRYGHIYPKIYAIDNLREAHKNARKDKTYYQEVKAVDALEDYYLKSIQEMLKTRTYSVSKYSTQTIVDKGKERDLMKLPYYPDRIIQWAIMLQIEPVFMKTFTNFTCASLKFRGIHKASKLVTDYMKDEKGTKYCLKFDIRKFYPSIDHVALKSLLRKKFKDPDLLWLLDSIIDSIPGDKGVPIGSYLSQYLANFYLAYFDHWLKEDLKLRYVVRYMDDVVIFHSSKKVLHRTKEAITHYLDEQLKLELKDNWQIFPTAIRGVDFVGYRHFYGYKLLRKKTSKRFKQKMLRLQKKQRLGLPITYRDWCSFNSYKGWLVWCDSYRLTKKYAAPLQGLMDEYYQKKNKERKKIA